jgi:DNA-binding transcriptional LysR family regulator
MSMIVHVWCEMAPMDLNPLRFFVAVYETGSFSAAAQRLEVPRSTVSRAVAALEGALDTTLFQRDTRNVAATAEGRLLYDRVAPALTELQAGLTERPATRAAPNGTLRLTATGDIATVALAETVTRFTARYPEVKVELHLTSKVVDLVREGFDLAVRVASRPLRGSALIARKIGTVSLGLYAAPSFLARHGVPRTPTELAALDWIGFRGAPPLQLPSAVLASKPRIVGDDMFFVREALRLGGGIGALPSFLAADDLARGLLTRVLPQFVANTGTIYLVHPPGRHVPARVTAFRELVLEVLRQRPITG